MDQFWLLLAGLIEDKAGDLVQRLKAHDPQAMADLYDIYGRLMYALTVRIVHNPSAAEDLVQEAFLRVWNRAGQLDDKYGSVGPWLTSIVRNCALDYRKSSQARLSAQVEMDETDFPPVTMENDILNSDRVRQLKDAFGHLNPNQRRVLELAYFEGLSQHAIAETLHQPLGTVKGWTRSALQKLRGELEPTLAYNH